MYTLHDIHMYTHTCIHECIYIQVFAYASTYMHYIYVYPYMHYICVYVMYIYIHTNTFTFVLTATEENSLNSRYLSHFKVIEKSLYIKPLTGCLSIEL